nr:hypothetical protein [Synechococcus sp. CCY 0621]
MHVVNGGAACRSDRRFQFIPGQLRPAEHVVVDRAVVDQHLGQTFQESLKGLAGTDCRTNAMVHGDQGDGGNQVADQSVVAAIHGVLDGVRKEEQQHQQKEIDNGPTEDNLPDRGGKLCHGINRW